MSITAHGPSRLRCQRPAFFVWLLAAGLVTATSCTVPATRDRLSWVASLDPKTPADGSLVLQRDLSDCGAAALQMILHHHGITDSTLEELDAATSSGPKGSTFLALKRAAESRGLSSLAFRVPTEGLSNVPTPAIAHVHGDHFVVIRSIANDVIVDDPSLGRLRMSRATFLRAWDGIVLTFSAEAHSLSESVLWDLTFPTTTRVSNKTKGDHMIR